MSHSDGKGSVPKIYSIFHGEVASLQTYGAFVKIPGCKRQGLVHKSQMSSAHIEDPSEMLSKGEMVYCKVMGFEGEGEKISLSMKVVNQTTGKDLDPNNVQLDQDAKKRRQWKHIGKDKIELGAELNTTCRRCGGHGHLTIDCFAGKDGTQYELIPDLETLTALPPASELSDSQHKKKKKKKEKKKKKKSKKKKRQSSSSSGSSASDDDDEKEVNRSGPHSHRDRSHKSSHKDDVHRRQRRNSDKQSRSSSSTPEHNNVGTDKRERRVNSAHRSDESSSSPPRQRARGQQGENYHRAGSPARSRDNKLADQGHMKRRRRHDDPQSSISSDSPSHEQRGSRRPEGQNRLSRQDSGNKYRGRHSRLEQGVEQSTKFRDRSSRRSSGEDAEKVTGKFKGQTNDNDSHKERSRDVDKQSPAERVKFRQPENSPERSERRISHTKKDSYEERRRRSRSISKERDRKRKKRRTRSSS